MEKTKLTYKNDDPKWLEFMASLYKEKTLVDVTLQIDEEDISAHKAVLAYRSKYFRKVLVKNWRKRDLNARIFSIKSWKRIN